MDTLSDLRSAVQSDQNISSNSSLFPEDTIDSALNRAYIKIGGLFHWPQLADAKKTSTAVSEYYDAPDTWYPDSIYRLEVDDELYGQDPDGSPMDFNDYLLWKEDNENSTDKKWAVHNNQFFIYPAPTVVGDNNISVWGLKRVVEMTVDGSTTIFSYNMPECNEAVVEEAKAILKNKGEAEKSGQLMSDRAMSILVVAFEKTKREKAKYEKTQPFFNVPDYFGPGTVQQNTGNFD